jgi:site-specific recombinase XerD
MTADPHELRYTAASLAVAAGANVKAVQRICGLMAPSLSSSNDH